MNKFYSTFPNGKTQRKHTSHICHTQHEKHAQHALTHQHKHVFMYSKVYTCAHCGHKANLAKFYYANMLNKNIWVLESTNPIGSKKIQVPKNAPSLIDLGVSSSSKTQGEMVLWWLMHQSSTDQLSHCIKRHLLWRLPMI